MTATDYGADAAPDTPRDTSGLALGRTGESNLQHGCHSAVVLQPRALEIADQLKAVVPGYEARLEYMVSLLALQLSKIERAEAWLATRGYWNDRTGKLHPPAKLLTTWTAEARRLLAALGMDQARGSMPAVGPDLARLLSGLVEGTVQDA